MSDYKASKSEIIAQLWFFSCDAPDHDETAKEIQRLSKMIDSVFDGNEPKWKVFNHSLSWKMFGLFCKLLGKLSFSDVSRLIGEKDATILDKWYFENRSKYQ
jgi:hypothetical protein